MSTALTRTGGGFSIAPANMGELWTFCERVAASDLVPKDYRNKPENCMVAVQMGGELGISPLQALQNIAVINGRPSVWGDAMIALCMSHPDYVDTEETYNAETRTAMCVAKRRGRSDKIETFSWADAQAAKLDVKDTYKQYPKRMLQMRARGFALRDQWTDVLKGLISAEEAQDYPKEVRAEVVSQRTVEKPKAEPKQERKSEPPPAAASVVPSFSRKFPDKKWAGKPLAGASGEILSDYAAWVESLQKDPKATDDMHRIYQRALDDVAAAVDALIASEAAKASDPIIEGLEAEVAKRDGGDSVDNLPY